MRKDIGVLISEIFHSIQGEGELVGVPSVFVRTSGCNLRCTWCDTPYASWQPEGTDLETGKIMEVVRKFGARHVVVTGGEPMVARGIHELLQALREDGRHITIETAATIPPSGIACDLASLSPKLAHSTPDAARAGAWSAKHEAARWNSEVLCTWMSAYSYQLKVVVRNRSDVEELSLNLQQLAVPLPPEKVILMPEGIEPATIAERSRDLAEICKETGWRLGARMHVQLWGNTRGT
jgi:7-carboxy-7-deazaguanine synthase